MITLRGNEMEVVMMHVNYLIFWANTASKSMKLYQEKSEKYGYLSINKADAAVLLTQIERCIATIDVKDLSLDRKSCYCSHLGMFYPIKMISTAKKVVKKLRSL